MQTVGCHALAMPKLWEMLVESLLNDLATRLTVIVKGDDTRLHWVSVPQWRSELRHLSTLDHNDRSGSCGQDVAPELGAAPTPC